MRYVALATDYDGTLAKDGRVSDSTVSGLERLRTSGRRAILVTGRHLDDLQAVFPRTDLFARVVAENGAVVYDPSSREQEILGEPPPSAFFDRLRATGVPVTSGRVIASTWEPHQHAVLEAIRELGLEHQVIFNKGAVMVLPPGVNKASGLRCALDQLGLSPHNVVGIGDAENDHALLAACECSAAVANALPLLKDRADLVTAGDHGSGVEELIEGLRRDDLSSLDAHLWRHNVLIGRSRSGDFGVSPYGVGVLIAGQSGSGKSTLVSGFIERLAEAKYQYCVIDPEGDYEGTPDALAIGTTEHPPSIEQILAAQASADRNTIANLLAIPLAGRPQFFASLLPRLLELRAAAGRPHWLVIDEVHHLLGESAAVPIPAGGFAGGVLMVTVHPEKVSRGALAAVDVVIATGNDPASVFGGFARAIGIAPPTEPIGESSAGASVWLRREGNPPLPIEPVPAKAERRRHRRKYAQGELPPDRNFVFRGPQGKLNLRAQNLQTFLQMGEGVDDETWTHHLEGHDYSSWIRQAIKDEALAADLEKIENQPGVPPFESRKAVREAIERRYTSPA